ncbi:MAG TPA: tetratricopeptide repeat protein [Paucimonas sp.]|nr:tetratricopeptide repeat protein [Paucimonas sp.]
MKRWIIPLLSAMLAACATPPQSRQVTHLFNDHLFAPPSERISAEDIFAITPEMQQYVHKIAYQERGQRPQRALFDALYHQSKLQLEYDSTVTRNAAQTFDTRSGNCLSLAIMTAALAREIGLTVQYHRVHIDEVWSRSGSLYFSSGHINLRLEKKRLEWQTGFDTSQSLTIDFLPPAQTAGLRTTIINEQTVVAMFMNNRAAEALARGNVNDAYWWAREAVRQDPRFFSAYNTLGVVYQRRGHPQEARQVLSQALELEPKNTIVMFNLAQTLRDLGLTAEASRMTARLEELQPHPPYHFFKLGKDAMQQGDFRSARDLFAKEVERDPSNHEFQFWLASAYFRLGDTERADRHMKLALENSTTRGDRELYAAKLHRLKAYLIN